MLNTNKSVEHNILKISSYKDGNLSMEFLLDKKKMLVGSFEGSDIKIIDQYVSHYHALVIITEEGFKIIDLESSNGVYINGKKVSQDFFYAGDVLQIGKTQFHVTEYINDKPIVDFDAENTTLISEEEITNEEIETPPIEGLVVVDNEYCDIIFNESNYTPTNNIPVIQNKIDLTEYVDTDDEKMFEDLDLPCDEHAIEISTMSRGNLLNVEYIPIKDNTFYISGRETGKNIIHLGFVENRKKKPFIKIKNSNITLYNIEGIDSKNITTDEENPFGGGTSIGIKNDDVICFTHKTLQIIIKITKAPPKLKNTPFFVNDKEFNKQSAKVIGALLSIMLLLLLVNIDDLDKEPEKQIAVIYKKAVRSDTNSKKQSTLAGTKNDNAVKQKESPKKKVAFKKQGQPKPTKSKPAPQKPKAAPQKKVAKAPKVKAYEFKMKNSLSSLLSSSKNLKNVKMANNSRAIASNNNFDTSKSKNVGNLKSKAGINVGSLGADYKGSMDRSSGAKGLGSKHGIDTTYIEPKTVILGSMDPELLRKILKEYLPQFRHCYQQELQEHSENVKGVVDLNFRIEKNGKVSRVDIRSKSSRFSQKGIGCMAKVLKIIEFPKPKGGGVVDVRQPLNFYAEKDRIK